MSTTQCHCKGCVLELYIAKHNLDIDKVPVEVLREAFASEGHVVKDDYVYGIKWVDDNGSHMFTAKHLGYTPRIVPQYCYEVGKEYEYVDGYHPRTKVPRFHTFCNGDMSEVHSVGLWAWRCTLAKLDRASLVLPSVLVKPILVKFRVTDAFPMHMEHIKGRRMNVVAMDLDEIRSFIAENQSRPPLEGDPKLP